MNRSLYDILEVQPSATTEEIKKAYRRLALRHHPDRKQDDTSALLFIEIKDAYETLVDPVKRLAYDSHLQLTDAPPGFIHSFYVLTDRQRLRVFDELRVSFVYTGHGRFFKKPDFLNFFITGVPYVSIRKIKSGNTELKETTLTYVVCPMKTGILEIDVAAVRIDNRPYFTEKQRIEVTASFCFYSNNKEADGRPYMFPMYYEGVTGSDKIRLMKNFSHTVLIPRSAYAHTYHRIGKGLKVVMMIWGIVLCMIIQVNLAAGAVSGLLFGGLMARILYRIAGVKPVFIHSSTFPLVQEYHLKGYQTGTDSGSRFLKSSWVYHFERFLF